MSEGWVARRMALAGGLASPVSRRGLVGEYGMGVHLLTTDGAGITISTLIGQEVNNEF